MTYVRPLSRAALLGWVLFVLLAVWALTLGGGWAGIYGAGLRWISLLLTAAGLFTWGLVAWRRPEWRPRSVIWPALLVPLAAMAVSTAASPTPRLGVEYLAWSVLLVALYLLLVRVIAYEPYRQRIGSFVVVMCLIIGGWYVVSVLTDWVQWWGLVGHLARPPLRPMFEGLTYGNPSAVMTMTVLLWIAALGVVGVATSRRRLVLGSLGVTTLLVILMSGSRAGWLAIALTMPIVGALWLASPHGRAAARALAGRRPVLAGGAAVVLLGAALAALFLPGFLARASAGGEDLRATFFVTAMRMFETAPLLGTGPGTWVAQRTAFTETGEFDYYIPHAHSIYFQTLAETGLLGIVAGLVVVTVLGWLVFGAIRGGNGTRRRVGWAALLALLYISAHQLLDFYANMPAVILALALLIAWLDATAPETISRGRPPQWAGTGGAVLLVLGCTASLAVLWWAEQAASPMAEAVAAANDGNWDQALGRARTAVSADPAPPAYQLTLGLVEAHAGNDQAAADHFERAASADDLPQSWLNLAAEEHLLGQDARAREALGRALRLGAQQIVVNVASADLLLRMNDTDGADQRLATAIVLGPSLAGDPTLATRPDISSRWPAIVDAAISQASPSDASEIAMVAGRSDQARDLASRLSEPERSTVLLVIEAWAGSERAFAELRERAAADPLNASLASWCGRIANRMGMPDVAADYRRWVGMTTDGGGGVGELRVVPAGVNPNSRAGSDAAFYGHYTYRRPTPWAMLVPSLPHVVLE